MKNEILGNHCKLRNGYAFKSKDFSIDGIPIVRIGEIQDGEVNLKNAPRVKENKLFEKYSLNEGDILIAMSGATTGKLGRYNNSLKAYQNQRVGCFIPNSNTLYSEYLYHYLKSISADISKKAYGGGQPNISSTEINKFKIPITSTQNQKRIAQVLSDCEALIAKRKKSIALLDELVKSTFLEMFGSYDKNPFDFPKVKIEDVSTAIKDGPHVSPKYSESGIPIYSTRNIRPGRLVEENVKYVSKSTYEQLTKRFIPQINDVLLTKGGTTGYAKAVDFNWKFCIWVHIAVIRPSELVQPIYLENFLNSDFGYFQSQKLTKGIANKDLGLKRIAKIKLLLPDINLQIKFKNIVAKIDETKNLYQSHLAELENLYARLSQDAFKGELDLSGVVLRNDYGRIEEFDSKLNKNEINADSSKDQLRQIELKKYLNYLLSDILRNKLFDIEDINNLLKNIVHDGSNEEVKQYLRNCLKKDQIESIYSENHKKIMFKTKQ